MLTHPASRHTLPHPSRTIASDAGRRRTQYLLLTGLLTRVPRSVYEQNAHPARVLDLATGPRTSVWGWWTEPVDGTAPVPCLLWAGDLGWSAATVEPDVFDPRGYARSSWSHRATLLGLAVANATGPVPTLEQLGQRVCDNVDPDLGDRSAVLAGALLWGILQQQAARARLGYVARDSSVTAFAVRGEVDDALDRQGLGPDRVKVRLAHPDAGLDGLLRAVDEARRGSRRG